MVAKIEWLRREHTWSASRIEFELAPEGVIVSRRTISLILQQLGPNRRRFIDPNGDSNREPQRIVAKRPSHTVHVDVKKVGHIPNGGGWRVHGRESLETRAVERTRKGRRYDSGSCLEVVSGRGHARAFAKPSGGASPASGGRRGIHLFNLAEELTPVLRVACEPSGLA